MSSQKTLYILRHAKAQEAVAGQDDHVRQLNERGIRAAKDMGKYLFKQKIQPDKVLCSSAVRTTETLLKVEEAYLQPLPTEYTEKLYLASGNAMLTLISGIPDNILKLMLVGHNPGMHQLVLKLARTGSEKLLDKLAEKFPTCAFAEIDLGKIDWRDIGRTRGNLKNFVTPKTLE